MTPERAPPLSRMNCTTSWIVLWEKTWKSLTIVFSSWNDATCINAIKKVYVKSETVISNFEPKNKTLQRDCNNLENFTSRCLDFQINTNLLRNSNIRWDFRYTILWKLTKTSFKNIYSNQKVRYLLDMTLWTDNDIFKS